MSSQREAFERYRHELPLYDRLQKECVRIARGACAKAGIPCRVTGRAKDLSSFAKKLVRDNASFDGIYDKAGIRILPVYPDERSRAAEVVHNSFEVKWEEDKSKSLKPDQFAYRGHHFQVKVASADAERLPMELQDLSCEVQVQSPGESLWASVSHDLTYKTTQTIPPQIQRALNRISAVLELVDLAMIDTRTQILQAPDAHAARLLRIFERLFLQFVPAAYDKSLSGMILHALEPLLGDEKTLEARLDAFVQQQNASLKHIFDEYQEDYLHVLLKQPESLAVFFLLEQEASPEVEKVWPVDGALLEGLSSVWVNPIG